MVNCPNCDAVIDVDEDDLDEGQTLTCEECGADLSVTGLDPLELENSLIFWLSGDRIVSNKIGRYPAEASP